MISVVSRVAQAYFELLELDEQLAISKRARGCWEGTYKLFNDQQAGGLASGLQAFPRQTRAALSFSQHPRKLSAKLPSRKTRLTLCWDATQGLWPGTSTLVAQEMPLDIPVGLPSTLLERRPDVGEGEERTGPCGQRGK